MTNRIKIILCLSIVFCICSCGFHENKQVTQKWPNSLQDGQLKGKISSIELSFITSSDTFRSKVFYNDIGMLFQRDDYTDSTSTLITYDNDNHPLSQKTTNKAGKVIRNSIYSYSDNFRKQKSKDFTHGKLSATYYYIKDSIGNTITQYAYTAHSGLLLDSLSNIYNSKGWRTQQVIFKDNIKYDFEYYGTGLLRNKTVCFQGNTSEKYTYLYTFDANGNWIEWVEKRGKDTAATCIRKINYKN